MVPDEVPECPKIFRCFDFLISIQLHKCRILELLEVPQTWTWGYSCDT